MGGECYALTRIIVPDKMIVEKAPDQTKAPGATDKGETLSCRFEHVKAGWK